MTEMFQTFGRIGLYSFGGPAAQIALMHRILVEEKSWLSEEEYLNALSFSMLLPGPEAMQLATYSGWKKGGVPGGLLAGLLFVLPGACAIAILATLYVLFGDIPLIDAVFLGVQATVLAIVLEALLKVTKKAFHRRSDRVIAVLSFVAIFAFALPFPLIIGAAALWGYFTATPSEASIPPAPLPLAQTARTALIWMAIWAAPILVLIALDAKLLTDIAAFFSKLAVVTFGGAYAVLAYMTQTVVTDFGWITTEQMVDGLGLAETTPGPLILVTEFVGFLAGYASGGLALGFVAALITLWVTFVPCFLWIFAGAPYVERLIYMPRLSNALKAITAAVVGVILNLSIWFGAHVLFETVNTLQSGPIQIIAPDLSTLNWVAAGIAIIAGYLLLIRHVGIGWTLLVGAVLGALSQAV